MRIFCATFPDSQAVIGYYSLTFIGWEHDKAANVVEMKFDDLAPLPAIYLPKIGVCEQHARQGIGASLMRDAFNRSLLIAEHAAITTLTLHAVDAEKEAWYASLGFVRFQEDDETLAMGIALSQIRAAQK